MIFTFLKDEYRERALREYSRRRFHIWLNLAFLLSILLVGMIMPSYIALTGEVKTLTLERQVYSKKMKETGQTNMEERIRTIKSMMSALADEAVSNPVLSVIGEALSMKSDGLFLSSVSLERKKDGWVLSLAGKAASRDELAEFSRNLESSPMFSGIDLPISTLAKSRDIPFSISFRSKF